MPKPYREERAAPKKGVRSRMSEERRSTKSRREVDDDDSGWMKSGSDIGKEQERNAAEAERRNEQRKRTGGIDPNKGRFRLKPGEEADVIILDASPDTVAFYEHQLKKDGKWGFYESCPGEWSNCPLCSSGDNKAFVWFLTILDLRGYEKEDGTEVPYYRRLLPIKQTQASSYKRVLKAAMKEHGTIRGVMLTLERDSSDRSASIGEPVILDNGKMYDFLDEDEIEDEYGHAAIKTKTGDVLVKKNGLLLPFDYKVIFPKPDAKDIAKRWGLGTAAGSDEEYEEEKAKSRKSRHHKHDEDEDEDVRPSRRGKLRAVEDDDDEDEPRTKTKRRKVVDEDDDEEQEARRPLRRSEIEDEDEEEDEIPFKKGKLKKGKRKVVDEDEDEDDLDEAEEEEDEDDDVPARKPRGSSVKPQSRTVSRRKVEAVDDDEDVPRRRRSLR